MKSLVAFHGGEVLHLIDADGEELAQQAKNWLKAMPSSDELWIVPTVQFKKLQNRFGQCKLAREWAAFRDVVRKAVGAIEAQTYLYDKGEETCKK